MLELVNSNGISPMVNVKYTCPDTDLTYKCVESCVVQNHERNHPQSIQWALNRSNFICNNELYPLYWIFTWYHVPTGTGALCSDMGICCAKPWCMITPVLYNRETLQDTMLFWSSSMADIVPLCPFFWPFVFYLQHSVSLILHYPDPPRVGPAFIGPSPLSLSAIAVWWDLRTKSAEPITESL